MNAQIEQANDAWLNLLDSGDITEEDVREYAKSQIVTQQQEAVRALQDQYPIDSDSFDERTAELSARIVELDAEVERQSQARQEQIAKVAKYFPRALEVLDAINAQAGHEEREALVGELQKHEAYETEIGIRIATPWVIPRREGGQIYDEKYRQEFLDSLRHGAQDSGVKDRENLEFIDRYPDDRVEMSHAAIGAAVRQQYGREVEASRMVAYLVCAQPYKTWTRRELAAQIYDGEDAYRDQKACKVGSLLSSSALGRCTIIQDTLREENEEYSIQFGVRYKARNGVSYGRGERICRVLTSGDQAVSWEDHSDRHVDKWEGEPVVSQAPDMATLPEDPVVIDNPVDEAGDTSSSTHAESRFEPKWMQEVRHKIKESIKTLNDQYREFTGEPLDEDVALNTNSLRKLGLGTLGTPTNLERAYAAGIISKSELDDRDAQHDLTRIVTLSTLNKVRMRFDNKKSRMQILKVIDEEVASHLDELRDETVSKL